LARRAPGVLRFLRIPCRWQTSKPPTKEPEVDDDFGFLTAADFQAEGVYKVPVKDEDVLLDPATPPDLDYKHFQRLKGINFADRQSLLEKRSGKKSEEWMEDLDVMRMATSAEPSLSPQDMERIRVHKLKKSGREAEVQLDEMNVTTKEGMAAEMEKIDVPAQDYFNPLMFPQALDAGKWLPQRPKGHCIFCMRDPSKNHVKEITFTNVQLLHGFINERGMILSRRISHNCAKHQKLLAKAIRRARVIGFLCPVNDFYAPETFASTNLGDLAKLSEASLDLYKIKLPTEEEMAVKRMKKVDSDEQGHGPKHRDWVATSFLEDEREEPLPPEVM